MTKEQQDVKEFMIKAGQATPDKPTMPDLATRILRVKLIAEELVELCYAFGLSLQINQENLPNHQIFIKEILGGDLIEAVDATTDLRVVVIGTNVAMGVDGESCWDEVHRSNMSKFIDGYRREDRKWVKGPSYSPANLAPIIDAQSK